MSILQIELTGEELQLINEQARAQGFENGGAYLISLAQQLAHRKTDEVSAEQSAHEELLMEEALASGEGEVADDAWWEKLHADVTSNLEAKRKSAL